jgi:hypothetical protein
MERRKTLKTITVCPLGLQFDADQITQGDAQEQAKQAIDLINLELQSQPFGLGAQLIVLPGEMEIVVDKEEAAA